MLNSPVVQTLHLINNHPLELAAHPEIRAVLNSVWFGAANLGERLGAGLREFFERGNHGR